MKFRSEIKTTAKSQFLAQYGVSVGAAVIFLVFSWALVGISVLLIMPPLTVWVQTIFA